MYSQTQQNLTLDETAIGMSNRLLPSTSESSAGDYLRCGLKWLDALLVQRLGLQEVAISADLAAANGLLRGAQVVLRTRRYRGAGFAPLTLAHIENAQGGLCSLTVVGLPQPGSGLPILGMDLIALNGALSLVAVDLAPIRAQTWQTDCTPLLMSLQQQAAGSLIARKRPEFTVDTFSPLAVIAGARSGAEWNVFCALVEFLQRASDLWLRRMGQITASDVSLEDRGDTQAEAESVRRWLLAEQTNRKEHSALAAIFGPDFAKRYLHEFLFSTAAQEA